MIPIFSNNNATNRTNSAFSTAPFESEEPRVCLESQNTLVWRFPLEISQSSICGKKQLSNACTLIALKIAELIHIHNIEMPETIEKRTQEFNNSVNSNKQAGRVTGGSENSRRTILGDETSRFDNHNNKERDEGTKMCDDSEFHQQNWDCPEGVWSCMINGIVDGNEEYFKDAGNKSNRVYNLPDAIKACGSNFKEIDFKLCSTGISIALPRMIQLAAKCPVFMSEKRLFFVIIGCIRTVLVVYDRNADSLTLFDTHMHLWYDCLRNESVRHGALIATCAYKNLTFFGNWVQNYVFPDIYRSKSEFEISLVQLVKSDDSNTQTLCNTRIGNVIERKFPIFNKIVENVDCKNGKSIRLEDYPVLLSILQKPVICSEENTRKRRREYGNGLENYNFGKPIKIGRAAIHSTVVPPTRFIWHTNNSNFYS